MKIFLTAVLIAVIAFIVFVVIGTFMSCYYSIPYEEWVQLEKERAEAEQYKQREKERRKCDGRG